ncbi:MAG: methyltransferase [Polyangiales bacterium]
MGRFPTDSLFDRIGRAVAGAEALPRKELFESWEVARRVRRRFRGGNVLDLAGGHGLLAHMLLLLDDSSPTARVVDPTTPPSAAHVHGALVDAWPRLKGRVEYTAEPLEGVNATPTDLLVSVHACGALTDRVLDLAIQAQTRVAVLPCCHDARANDAGGLEGWLDPSLAIDATRVARLRHAGFVVHTAQIPPAITPKNRLLLAAPDAG